MSGAVHLEAVQRVLATLFPRGEMLLSSFTFGRPGAPVCDRRIHMEVFVDRQAHTEALLFIRNNGAPYLRSVSIPELLSMVADFVTANCRSSPARPQGAVECQTASKIDP